MASMWQDLINLLVVCFVATDRIPSFDLWSYLKIYVHNPLI